MGQRVEIVSLIAIFKPTRSQVSSRLRKNAQLLPYRGRAALRAPLSRGSEPTDPAGTLPPLSSRTREDTSKVVPYHSPVEGFGGRLELVPLTIDCMIRVV